MHELKEVIYSGEPGNLCVVVNSDERYEGLPTRGIAWGPFDDAGEYRVIVDPEQYPILVQSEIDGTPEAIDFLERNWHINTA